MADVIERGCPKCQNVWKIKPAIWGSSFTIEAKKDVEFAEDYREGIRFLCKKCGAPVAILKWEELKDM